MAAHNSRVYYWGESSGPIRGDIIELACTGSTWTSDVAYTVTSLAEPATPITTGGLSGFAVNGAQPRVYYLSREALIELAWAGSKWITTPIARDLGAPTMVSDGDMVSFAVNGSAPRVYYFDENRYVCELAWTSNGWVVNRIAEGLGAPQSAGGGALTGFALGGSASRVYYVDGAGYVNELAWTGHKWAFNAIARNAAAPPAIASSSLASYEVAGNAPRVYYCDEELRITELAWTSGDWAVNTIAGTASAPAVHPGRTYNGLRRRRLGFPGLLPRLRRLHNRAGVDRGDLGRGSHRTQRASAAGDRRWVRDDQLCRIKPARRDDLGCVFSGSPPSSSPHHRPGTAFTDYGRSYP